MICSHCKTEKATKPTAKGERLPKGWKRHNGVWCQSCWRANYVLRAITIPVLRPLGEGIGWPELREALNESWSLHTAATNFVTSKLYAGDTHRNGQDKLPSMPKTYVYPETVKAFPELPSQSAAAIENAVKGKYSSKRYNVIWSCAESLPNARYPQPAIASNQSWNPSYETAGKEGGDLVPCVSVTLLRGQRFLLQLRGGSEFRRQLNDFKLVTEGKAIQGELALLRKKSNGSDHRNGGSARDSGGQKFATRIMVKMVAWFPRKESSAAKGTLFVRSDSQSFLIALDNKANKLRVWNSDHARRWIAEHRRQLNRWSDDQKAEQRQPRRKSASFQSRREAAVLKFRSRIDSLIKETSSQIAGVAKRMQFATVELDTSDRSFFGSGRFDWSGFETYLSQRLNQEGITLELASSDEMPKNTEPLANKELINE